MKKKTEHSRRSVRYEYVIDYTCEHGCIKVENVKKAKMRRLKVRQGGCSQASAHRSTLRVQIYCAGQVKGWEGTSNNRLWSPQAYGLAGQ